MRISVALPPVLGRVEAASFRNQLLVAFDQKESVAIECTTVGTLPALWVQLLCAEAVSAQTRKLAVEVANQTGASGSGGSGNGSGGTGSPGTSPGSAPPPSSAPGPGASPSVSLPTAQTGPGIILAAAHPRPADLARFALPALLILGGLLALAGSSALLGTAEGGVRGRLRALNAGTAALGRSARARIRPNRTAK